MISFKYIVRISTNLCTLPDAYKVVKIFIKRTHKENIYLYIKIFNASTSHQLLKHLIFFSMNTAHENTLKCFSGILLFNIFGNYLLNQH